MMGLFDHAKCRRRSAEVREALELKRQESRRVPADMPFEVNRRAFLGSTLAGSAVVATSFNASARTRPALARVILDNDFAGDPDGLFQLAHHVLCPSLDIPLVIGSHLPAQFSSGHDARDSAEQARELLRLMRLDNKFAPIGGAEAPIADRASWSASPATDAIVREAMRDDAPGPLVYAAGAGLTELALAWLKEPRIGRRIRLVWIGGNTPPGAGAIAPDAPGPEFNFMIDPLAAQVIFNESDIEIWQVPSAAYRQMLFGNGELDQLARTGPLGSWLKAKVDAVPEKFAAIPGVPPILQTDAYVMGDSPLVTLTALVPPFGPDPASSRYTEMPTPKLQRDGTFQSALPGARPMRVYTQIDSSLTFRDMVARFQSYRPGRKRS